MQYLIAGKRSLTFGKIPDSASPSRSPRHSFGKIKEYADGFISKYEIKTSMPLQPKINFPKNKIGPVLIHGDSPKRSHFFRPSPARRLLFHVLTPSDPDPDPSPSPSPNIVDKGAPRCDHGNIPI